MSASVDSPCSSTIAEDPTPFWELSVEQFDEVQRTNVRGTWLYARACVPLLGDGASIVLMGSMTGFISDAGLAAYSASKGALLQLARGMALDLAASGRAVRVNVVCPGVCETPTMRRNVEGPSA